MSPKTLEPTSDYAKYDVDGDGVVSDEELAAVAKLEELEMQEEKADAQRRMAWYLLFLCWSSLALCFYLFSPIQESKPLLIFLVYSISAWLA